ncbi:MAG TPA: type II secretion system protein [Candidatus Paceibacterota bacterium]|nr:type II secretion system protein [Candidatus Paceibacterota bacterium]
MTRIIKTLVGKPSVAPAKAGVHASDQTSGSMDPRWSLPRTAIRGEDNTINRNHSCVRRRGFSLIEIIFAVAVAASIFFAISSMSGNLVTLENFLNQKLQSRQDVDQAFQILTTEIRSAGPSAAGAYAIDSAGTSTFIFYSDIGKNGTFARVRYFLGTSTIQKGVTRPAGNPPAYATSSEIVTTVVSNVVVSTSTSLFAYYDSNYTGTQSPMSYPLNLQNIRLVNFSAYVDVNVSSSPTPEYFSGSALMRNLRSN